MLIINDIMAREKFRDRNFVGVTFPVLLKIYICAMVDKYISKAGLPDIAAIEELVNSAYRGDDSKKGWTSEADLIDGSLRTDINSLRKILSRPGATILKYTNDAGEINGCVYLQFETDCLELGMLSVDPTLQASGIGKKLLQAAIAHAKEAGVHKIKFKVISLRSELVAWYQRHGYQFTGEIQPMPPDANFGKPRQPLELATMALEL